MRLKASHGRRKSPTVKALTAIVVVVALFMLLLYIGITRRLEEAARSANFVRSPADRFALLYAQFEDEVHDERSKVERAAQEIAHGLTISLSKNLFVAATDAPRRHNATAGEEIRPSPSQSTAQTSSVPPTTQSTSIHSIAVQKHSFSSVDVEKVQPNPHKNPGGSEEEALRMRRDLSRRNWPMADASSQQWRTGGNEKPAVPAELLCLQGFSSDKETLFRLASRRCPRQNATSRRRTDSVSWRCLFREYSRAIGALRPAPWSHRCESQYGAHLIDRFQKSTHKMCVGPDDKTGRSSITCKMVRVDATHEIDTSMCDATDVVVDFSRIKNGDFPWLDFRRGAFQAECRVPGNTESHWKFMHCQKDWMDLGFESVGPHRSNLTTRQFPDCGTTIDIPTFFVTRSGDYSPFAMLHDWINAVLLFAIEDIDPSDTQVVLMDRMTAGFYSPVWQLLFSPSHQLLWYPDLHEQYHGSSSDLNRVCYRQMWFNIPARLSPVYNQDDCTHAPLFGLARDLLLSSIHALQTTSVQEVVVVTFIVRRNYATGHEIGRQFANGREMVVALREAVGHIAVVNEVDYAAFDFDQQVNISRATDVLVAMHGAGLAHIWFLPSHASVFEFFCLEKPSSNYRYRQLSQKMGIDYKDFSLDSADNRIPIQTVVPVLRDLVRQVQERKLQSRNNKRDG